jgi:hypothetical protein
MRTRRALPLLLCAVGLHCGGSGGTPPPPGAPEILEFNASSTSVDLNSMVTLSWQVKDATAIDILATPGGPLDVQQNLASGMVMSQPLTAQTTFTLTARGQGQPAVKAVIVAVTVGEPVAIDMFAATPMTIAQGGSSTLNWKTHNATSIEIDDSNLAIVVPEGANTTGAFTVTPTVTTNYTLHAKGPGGPVAAQISVIVMSAPKPSIGSFAAVPQSITTGQMSALSWNVTNALSVRIADAAGTELYTGPEQMGNISVSPAATTLYTLTASNTAGITTASAAVTVNPPVAPRIDHFTSSTSTIVLGQSALLDWSVEHTSLVVLSATRAIARPLVHTASAAGSLTVTPTRTTDYVLIAEGAGANAQAMLRVTLLPPQILAFSAMPSPGMLGTPASLAWHTQGAARVRLRGPAMMLLVDTATRTATGSVSVTLTSTLSHFELDADNASGTATSGLDVPTR